ncbi:conserved hypothetical protein [Talaromyces stipitatus ATCC 10500]|uniref:DUF4238 domain-containing protein n=1 Tax=Talaromyces stipitatus (strain ATCC 10500 / CBS 375.48 / QM 6759 / NRRL 1006) TaxID=441959 RepID=B8LY50_TALSN|nr:uncharacterized protein TSTA_067340 [Talaromyces stipitatus ATCC 10500]EED23296.1 conserved hypothetical protein [Talaromyces stipitatus ATCC 10500]
MAAPQSSSSSVKSQYHHFIPQFILRNYAHVRSPKRRGRGKWHSSGEALHVIDLSSDNPELVESPVRRTFGLTDMYRDFARVSDQQYLEKELSKLEGNAARIIVGIRKAFESGHQDVWIKRHERDSLRKFLFIMKYRGKGFHKRFVGDGMKGYVEDDKELFLKYMREKGFKKPVDVWYHSIKTILELKMDLQGNWVKKLLDGIYRDDAMWFIMHTEFMYLSLCTPSEADTEFLLTENCYNVFEGPQTILRDPKTGQSRFVSWTNFHEFSPISPKLLMVLRSFILPNPEEDKNEGIRKWRENIYKMALGPHANPRAANSILADLPIHKPRNSYSSVSSQGIELLEGEDGSRRSNHRFCFPFFKISTEQTNKINTIFLDNAYRYQTVAFTSRPALKATLEYYLTLPPSQGFKKVGGETNDVQLSYLLKLEKILRKLGSNKKLVYQLRSAELTDDVIFEFMGDMLTKNLPEQPTEFMQLYMKLGGNAETLAKDLDQTRRMINLRIQIDVCTQGLREIKRQDIREKLRDHFCQLVPPRRLWLYLKQIRLMSLKGPASLQTELDQEYGDGPEDIIVKASHIIRTEDLGRLMHFSVVQHVHLLKYPDLDMSANITMDEASAKKLWEITSFAFGSAGSICDCGKIEPASST